MTDFSHSPATRLPVPKELKLKVEKLLWANIIGSYGADYFNQGDVPLLVSYVRMTVLSDKYYKLLGKLGDYIEDSNGRLSPSPYFKMLRDANTTQMACAQKLRIAPSGRVRPEQVKQSNRRAKEGRVFDPKSDWESHQRLDG